MIGINVQELADWISRLGFGGLLTFILIGFQQGWWVFGRERDEMLAAIRAVEKDRDEWKALAMSTLGASERTVRVTQAVLSPALPPAEGAA